MEKNHINIRTDEDQTFNKIQYSYVIINSQQTTNRKRFP